MLAMTMVMPMMLTLAVIMTVTPSGVFLCCCGIACIRLFTLFWILNTLWEIKEKKGLSLRS